VRVASGSAELYLAILGVLSSGAAYVPVDAEEPAARAAAIFAAGEACAVIEDGLRVRQLAPAAGARRTPSAQDDAWVIFTSGSTGAPKGVAVSHSSAAAFVEAETRLWHVSEHDRVLAGLSVGFDASCEEMWLAWRNGAALVPAPRALVRSGEAIGPWLAERRVSVVSTVPTLAALWQEETIAGVRLLILGGEACPNELGWRLAATREVWNTYGPTEATVVSTADIGKVLAEIGGHTRFIELAKATHVVGQGSTVCGSALIQAFVSAPARVDSLDAACARQVPAIHAVGAFPARLADVKPLQPEPAGAAVRSAAALKLAAAALATAGDAVAREAAIATGLDRGLHGGDVTADPAGTVLHLHGDQLVPGVAVSGTVTLAPAPVALDGQSAHAQLSVSAQGQPAASFTADWTTQGTAARAQVSGTVGGEAIAGSAFAP
jgi:acyl-CoA synthetase (AMP-forming)/AMP-acid ligase II